MDATPVCLGLFPLNKIFVHIVFFIIHDHERRCHSWVLQPLPGTTISSESWRRRAFKPSRLIFLRREELSRNGPLTRFSRARNVVRNGYKAGERLYRPENLIELCYVSEQGFSLTASLSWNIDVDIIT